jgi:hypothetical protein
VLRKKVLGRRRRNKAVCRCKLKRTVTMVRIVLMQRLKVRLMR